VPAETSIEIYGVREALRELGTIDPKLRLKAVGKIKGASGELLAAARENYPSDTQLQESLPGWQKKGRLGYSKATADKGVQVQVGGRSRGNAYAIVTIIQKNAGGALFDIAGLRDGTQGGGSTDKRGRPRQPQQSEAFLRQLDSDFGKAQRGMWRSIRRIRDLATGQLMKALEEVAEQVNRKLVA
jgi:hypothetical protein